MLVLVLVTLFALYVKYLVYQVSFGSKYAFPWPALLSRPNISTKPTLSDASFHTTALNFLYSVGHSVVSNSLQPHGL